MRDREMSLNAGRGKEGGGGVCGYREEDPRALEGETGFRFGRVEGIVLPWERRGWALDGISSWARG